MDQVFSDVAGSVEQVDELRRALAERVGKLRTNLTLGPGRISCAIERGMVRYEARPESLLVFKDEGAFELVYYYLAECEAFPRMTWEKPVVIEEIDQGGVNTAWREAFARALRDRGWRLAAANLQVAMDLSDGEGEIDALLERSSAALRERGLSFEECGTERADEVVALWREHLKATDVPADHFGFAGDASQNVVCVVDGEGSLCGVNWWRCAGRTCEVRHTVTVPDRQRQGIGLAMLAYTLDAARRAGCTRAYTYIDEENTRSLALYGKCGFSENGRSARQYVLD